MIGLLSVKMSFSNTDNALSASTLSYSFLRTTVSVDNIRTRREGGVREGGREGAQEGKRKRIVKSRGEYLRTTFRERVSSCP